MTRMGKWENPSSTGRSMGRIGTRASPITRPPARAARRATRTSTSRGTRRSRSSTSSTAGLRSTGASSRATCGTSSCTRLTISRWRRRRRINSHKKQEGPHEDLRDAQDQGAQQDTTVEEALKALLDCRKTVTETRRRGRQTEGRCRRKGPVRFFPRQTGT